ncbi:hypothetical protein [Uliginosibacterium aquaticum]|uniref:Fimbrial assembly protein n=1 Tax=Uliginosibacterium aquaticum TaxID=2731212 RepID=A0ABX2IK83_9RHOO|nr:hypothetical protein [Uliginosibacterium aquaticum]NSL56722.1 hypothetical protein [Uliginosibacterium aquaticum]
MKSLQIEFASSRTGGHRSSARKWSLAVLVGGALALFGLVAGSSFSREAGALRQQAAELAMERDALRSAARHQEQIAPDMLDSINGVIRIMDYPLIDILEALEHRARPNVALMSAELGPVRSTFRIIVQAASLPEALDYLEDMRNEPGFQNLALTRQEASGGDGQGWRFTLEMPQADAVPRALSKAPARGQE